MASLFSGFFAFTSVYEWTVWTLEEWDYYAVPADTRATHSHIIYIPFDQITDTCAPGVSRLFGII